MTDLKVATHPGQERRWPAPPWARERGGRWGVPTLIVGGGNAARKLTATCASPPTTACARWRPSTTTPRSGR